MTIPVDTIEQAVTAELRGRFGRTGLVRRDAAAAADMSISTFSRKLNNRLPITIGELDTIATFLGTTSEEILTEARKLLS